MVSIQELERYAELNNVPIMNQEGISFLTDYIAKNNIKNILEIGSAIGYSAIKMAQVNPDIKVVTIERDIVRYDLALENIKNFELDNQIEIIFGDALNTDITGSYDLIFIDAAKSQYIKFFERYSPLLSETGVIVSDNLNFHGLINSNGENLSANVRGLIRKLNKYIDYLKNNPDYKTEFFNIGDGVSISKKNK